MRRLIVHVGAAKCGSTYLQRVLGGNRDLLAAHGIAYPAPQAGHPGNGAELGRLGHRKLETLFGTATTLILSHEDLLPAWESMTHLPDSCAALGAEMTVLAALRPFSDIVFGDYSQHMKQHFEAFLAAGQAYDGLGFEDFAVRRRERMAPRAWLHGWQALSARPLVIVRHDALRDAVGALLGPLPIDWHVNRHKVNRSLRVADCEDIARAIAAGLDPRWIEEMRRLAFATADLPDPGRTPERRRWIEALFRDDCDRIAAEFGFDNHHPDTRPALVAATPRVAGAAPGPRPAAEALSEL